jgi:hypothetical protein
MSMTCWRMGSLENGETDGIFTINKYDGKEYVSKKYLSITFEEARRKNIFKGENITEEDHPDSDKLTWSRKDDDKYRNLIK